VNELLTVHFLVQAGAGVSLVPSSASRMRVPSVRLLDTHLAEAKWKIGLTWRKRDQSAPLFAISLVLQVDSAMPPRECSRLKTLGDVLSEIGLDFCELLLR
jgi:DNA-binding transcriptional LysR family regulator